ncbi:hypothetical protein DXT68_08060 [Microbacterium foliorum]|uniref:Uncharacterized protein n=2 Tax=Microbacterium TaxID=33882 RepID=A0A0F0KA26_9MICO|nr:hypothetical protein [Microbacterium foliorum]AXL12094.1 hypothetical protein DXT68_08060 [Microbacterium foliorum]KJL17733.1 hypothetical protein RN50_02832 [Microbacterium foliorum]KQZ25580.1 hypothetical protein ASD43_11075 [Microbacterium sp. Root553]
MISSVFNNSASNFGNAAMRAASVPLDAPVEVRLGAAGPGETGASIEVTGPSGFLKRIPIDDARLAECRLENGGPTVLALCQQFVDDLSALIKSAVRDASEHE